MEQKTVFGRCIEGKQITLAPPVGDYDYIGAWVRWFADPVVTRYLTVQNPLSREDEQKWFETMATNSTDVFWSIEQQGRLIGSIGVHNIDWKNRSAETGMVIGERDCWGHGYATEAMSLRSAYAFEELGLETLSTKVRNQNIASRRALERSGYKQAGILRRHSYFDGQFHDSWIMELLREEWLSSG